MTSAESARRRAITAERNDAFRRQLPFAPQDSGRFMLTAGVAALPPDRLLQVLRLVREFDAFTPDNDPWKEHDCAVVVSDGDRFIWKFDYYETDECVMGAADGVTCYRVLTLMFAQEY